MRTPHIAIAGLLFLLWLLHPVTSQAQGGGAAQPTGPEGVERLDASALEEIDAARTARRNLPDNRLRKRISRYLSAAAKKTEKGDTDGAVALLGRLNPKRMNVYERALVDRLRAFVLYTAGDPLGAIQAFRGALDEQILELRDEERIRFNIAQLYASQQKWPETIAALKDWFRYVQDPDPLGYYLLAVAHYQQDQVDEAIGYAVKAVDLSTQPKEGWLQLLAALYIQKEDYAKAEPILEKLVLHFPKKLYWVQLSLIYGARENHPASLAVQQVAYLQGLLTEDKELRRLARGYLFANLPYPAAKLLDKGLEKGQIKSDAEAYEMLANSWIAAREYDRSLEPLQKAAALSKDGNLYVRLGQVRLQREEWAKAAETLKKALDRGGLDKPGTALLLLGIATYNDGHAGPARSYFVKARQHESTRSQAEAWLKHLDHEAQNATKTGGAAAAAASGPAA